LKSRKVVAERRVVKSFSQINTKGGCGAPHLKQRFTEKKK